MTTRSVLHALLRPQGCVNNQKNKRSLKRCSRLRHIDYRFYLFWERRPRNVISVFPKSHFLHWSRGRVAWVAEKGSPNLSVVLPLLHWQWGGRQCMRIDPLSWWNHMSDRLTISWWLCRWDIKRAGLPLKKRSSFSKIHIAQTRYTLQSSPRLLDWCRFGGTLNEGRPWKRSISRKGSG